MNSASLLIRVSLHASHLVNDVGHHIGGEGLSRDATTSVDHRQLRAGFATEHHQFTLDLEGCEHPGDHFFPQRAVMPMTPSSWTRSSASMALRYCSITGSLFSASNHSTIQPQVAAATDFTSLSPRRRLCLPILVPS